MPHPPETPIWLDDDDPLPPTHLALGPHSEAPGLLAVGARVTPQRLREAYAQGIFPWYAQGQPVLWWSPDPRMVLPVAEFKLHPSLRKTLRRFVRTPGCAIRFNHGFEAVMQACASQPRAGQRGSWIVPEMVEAYSALHREGAAHSVETWMDGELAGGLYGVSLGRMFYGESMFARRSDASKLALAALVAHCARHGITLIDCQQHTAHLASLGARAIPRARFEAHLRRVIGAPPLHDWTYDAANWAALGPQPGAADPAFAPAAGNAR